MKPDIKELAYALYENFIKQDFHLPEPVKATEIRIGGIYFTVLNKKPVHFVVIRKVAGSYYEVLKLSSFYELSDYNDVYYRLNIEDQMYIIQTSLNFYLHSDEIKSSIYLENLSEEFLEELKKFIELSDDEKIEYKRLVKGFYYPVGNKWIRAFKQKELDIVKSYHLRIFEILHEEENKQVIELPDHIKRLIDREYRIKE
jgi:hypothetical protein